MKSNAYQLLNSRRTWFYIAFFGCILFAFTFSFFHQQVRSKISSLVNIVRLPTSGPVRVNQIAFSDYNEFQSLSSDTNEVWDNILTPNGGYIYKTDEDRKRHGYGISMFHQLHCLQMIRSKLQELTFLYQPTDDSGTRQSHAHEHHMNEGHVLHCLDYLRQGILCCADDTIEPPKTTEDGRNITNYKILHICADSGHLYALSAQSGFKSGNVGEEHHHEHGSTV